MKRGIAIVGLFIIIGGMAILLLGCGPRVVMVRPPEPRVEVQGSPPYPEAVWIGGYWEHRAGDWIWIPGRWGRPPSPNAVWIPGRWAPRRGGWTWGPGHWENR